MDENTTQTNQKNQDQPTMRPPMQQPRTGRGKKMAIWIVIFVLLALAGGGVAGYYIGKQEKDRAVEEARQQTRQELEKEKSDQAHKDQEATPEKTVTEATCNADELTLSIGEPEGAAGTFYYPVMLENTGERTCSLQGYPGVSLVNDNGNMIGNPTDRVPDQEEPLVTLNPGEKVESSMGVPNKDNFPEGECEEGATKLRVYPPNDTGYLSVATTVTTWCPGYSITPVVPAE